MTVSQEQLLKEALLEASPLQVHRKTDYPSMNEQLSGIFSEIKQLRKANDKQMRKAQRVRKHLDVLILDLWVAANYSKSPWRMISLNRNDYTKDARYRKLFLKYDLFNGVLKNLIALGYVEEKIGFFDKAKGEGFQSRIKASEKLLDLLEFDISKIERDPEAPEEETIIKKDENGKVIDYVDDEFTNQMREDLRKYNDLLRRSNIGTDGIDLRNKYDPTCITVKRIFNGESGGGRFYCGFWQTMPKDDRKKLTINGEEVCELDYSALHPTLAYALKGIPVTDDPYTIEGCDRSEVKKAFLVLFNCESRQHALNTIRSEFRIKNAESLLQKIEQKHEVISKSFYNPGFGLHLQNLDAWLAEKIINQLTERGIVCLPVHDSFIVSKKHEAELHHLMEETFYSIANTYPVIK
ncbi:hypothetical protein [Nitrosomonas communis]|uniref:DNA-directed DNA polymerase family A palm domain-containing protein n=1 Tax=Nitrosomonas communis TaxID=44574 RepID=A0A1I4S3E2_9PROT|nr:hypothetical protein [Nitrosomonas communis]SFM58921.1 hypothetical protein SAMN05421863_103718 [Nitrosomonas communis]